MIYSRRISVFIKHALFVTMCFGMWVLVSLFGVMQAQASDKVLLEKGEKLVRQHCTRCHVVGNLNKYGGIGSTPSFGAMKSLSDWQDRFATCLLYTSPSPRDKSSSRMPSSA